jgi:hypothetical protein
MGIGNVSKLLAAWGVGGFVHAIPRYSLDAFPEATRGRVTGVVKPLERRVLEAPVSGRLCVYHEIQILDVRDWIKVPLARERRSVPFVLEDETGRAIVDPEHARVECDFDERTFSKAAFDADARQRALLDRFSLLERDWSKSTGGIRYTEAVIALDETITLIGKGVREPDPEARPECDCGYREGGATRMRFTSCRKYPLVLGATS